jgi:hypothetical protein
MERRHFHVLNVSTPVRPLEFDPQIGKVHLPVEEWQVMLECPLFDLSSVPVRPPVRVRMVAISLVQEGLVLALQFVIENDAIDTDVVFLQPLHRSKVGRMQLCVVRQLTFSDVARIERLTGFLIGRPVTLQKLATSVCQRDQDGAAVVPIERSDGANQIR